MRAEDSPSLEPTEPSARLEHLERMQHEARRLDLASAIPRDVLAPMLYDVVLRHGDDAIVVIDAAESPSPPPVDLSSAMVAIVRRELLDEALGHAIGALATQRAGHVPFVVIDRHGTTVVFLELGPIVTAPGGSA